MSTIFLTDSRMDASTVHPQLLAQALGLQKRGYTCVVLCRKGSSLSRQARASGLHTEHLRFRNALDPVSLLHLASLLKRHQPVCIMGHSSHDSNLAALAVRSLHAVGFLAYRPAIIRVRADKPAVSKPLTTNYLYDLTLALTPSLRDELLEDLNVLPSRVRVLPPSIDPERIREPQLLQLPPSFSGALMDMNRRPLIAQVADVTLASGHDFMLSVIEELLPRFPRLLYVVVGEGPQMQAFQQAVYAKPWRRQVLFTGHLQHTAPLVRAADVLVVPSCTEPDSAPQLEALCLGTPLVVSPLSGFGQEHAYGDLGASGAWVCPAPYRKDALLPWLMTLENILQDPTSARQRAQAVQAKATQQFSPDAQLDTVLACFQHPGLKA